MNNYLICIIITLIKIYIHKKIKKKIIITHYPRTDRSGSFLLIDLFFYAYSKKWNYEFKINKDYNKRKEISNPDRGAVNRSGNCCNSFICSIDDEVLAVALVRVFIIINPGKINRVYGTP